MPKRCIIKEKGDKMSKKYIKGADPWVIKVDDCYYYCYSEKNGIYVYKTNSLHYIQRKGKLVYQVSNNINPWAPELHYINEKWYIYYAVPKFLKDDRRMFVLSSDDALGPYIFEGQITDKSDKWAIDGTVLEWQSNLYFIWSGWEGNKNISQNIYIAHMSSPTVIDSSRVKISEPEYEWEKFGNPLVNEGPEVLIKNDKLYIIYSASGSWTKNYCLGMLSYTGNDIMSKKSWKKESLPVFKSGNGVIAPGHACFVKGTDEKEDWIIYHSFLNEEMITWEDRILRMQKFTWNDNVPVFGKPINKNEFNSCK